MNIFIKQKQTHRVREQIYGYRGRERGGLDGQFETDMHTLLYLKLNAFPWKKEREAWLECGWAARKKERLNMRLSLKTFREWLLEGRGWGVLWIEGEFWAEKGLCFSLSLSYLMCSLWIYVSYLLKSQSYLHSICLNATLAAHLGEKVSE